MMPINGISATDYHPSNWRSRNWHSLLVHHTMGRLDLLKEADINYATLWSVEIAAGVILTQFDPERGNPGASSCMTEEITAGGNGCQI
ncbi:hypothetical protein DOTSEDRAFT_71157 [Dothistroma septosporum NZE10]|uniref:Uncharacterized protein n=1 Tax=Dothistroma septosporum (strain NZE10 / CBS 128990) TaxID=675120 RepID=N1PSJ1_DOTSN|nr:hypothetical protein DOTSEDRAFT_71157 [Dothistroma septosporum NZE10]